MSLAAHLLTRNAPDGWANTCAPASPADLLHMRTVRPGPAADAPATDPAVAAFNEWAARDGT